MAEKTENVIMFPFMAQGHIIPFVSLALHLQNKKQNLSITLINTPRNIKNIKRLIPPNSSIRLIEIPFDGSDYGIPPGVDNFDSLPYHLMPNLLHASTSLKEPFRRFLLDIIGGRDGETPICVIGDIFFGWMGGVCRELGVFHVIFCGASGYGMGCYYSMWVNLPHKKVKEHKDDDNFFLPDFQEAGKIHKTQLPASMLEANGSDLWSTFMSKNFQEWADSDGMLFNTVEEFDQIGLSYFRRKLGIPVWAIGPVLLSNERETRAGREIGIELRVMKEWLDSKPKNSVLYVSFGSMNTISLSHMQQLAMALESCGKNFIWVIRPPIGFDISGDFDGKEWLPEGFEERIKESGRGLLIKSWAPQVEILSHGSISAFLSHCGWNSILESLSYGVPLIAWSMAAEQFFNAKLLVEEVRVCLEIARGKSCEVKYEEIAEKINIVMEDKKNGRGMRSKANELKEIIKNAMNDVGGSSIRSMDEFLSAAKLIDLENFTVELNTYTK